MFGEQLLVNSYKCALLFGFRFWTLPTPPRIQNVNLDSKLDARYIIILLLLIINNDRDV